MKSNNIDNSYAVLNTWFFKEPYFISSDDNEKILIATKNSPTKHEDDFILSKESVFQKIFELGKYLDNNLKVVLSEDFSLFMEEKTYNIPNNIFNLKEEIMNNENVKKYILNFYNEIGFPEWNDFPMPFDYNTYKKSEKTFDTFPSKEDKLIITEGKNDFKYFQYFLKLKNILNNNSGNNTNKDINLEDQYDLINDSNLDYSACNILKYLNVSLIIYEIYNIKDVISNVKTKHLYDAIKVFPILTEKYNSMCFRDIETDEGNETGEKALTQKKFVYSKDFANEVSNYIKLIIPKVKEYIDEKLNVFNEEKIIFNNDYIPDSKKNINQKDFNFMDTIYIMVNPFLTAFEYLLRILQFKQQFPPIYFCDNCREVLKNKSLLCLNCKKKIAENFKRKFSNSKKKTTLRSLKDLEIELNMLEENHHSLTPHIDKLYRDKINSKNYYYNGGKEVKKQKYKNNE